MTEKKGITGIKETATGFLGANPKIDRTRKDNKTRIRFNIACGENIPQQYKYPTWRFCVAYSPTADSLIGIKKGSLVKVRGWIRTECLRDENGHPIVRDGVPEKIEVMILYEGEEIPYESKGQMSLDDINREPVLASERG